MKTKAAILVEQRKPLEIDEVEIPALTYGQVLVEIHVTRICGSQIGEIEGVKGPDRFLPHLLGHEAGAVVKEVGPEVKTVKPGDRVVCHWRPGDGIQASPPKYKWGSRDVNAGWITTFQEMAILSENRVTPIPDGIDFEVASLLADTLTTGFGIINKDAKVQIGESVVVIGSGGIGLGAIQGARLAGAHPIIAIDLHDHKLEKARQYGATHTINSTSTDFSDAVREIVGPQGADVLVEGTGNPAIIEKAYALTKARSGRTVLFGVIAHDKKVSINTLPLHFGRVLTGSEGGSSLPAIEIPRYCQMMLDKVFDPKGFVSHRAPLEKINEAITQMKAGEVIHYMIHLKD